MIADDDFRAALTASGEEWDDVEFATPTCEQRAADFVQGSVVTKGHVYTAIMGWWDEGGISGGSGYYPRLFVAKR